MAILYFSGDQVAFFGAISDSGGSSHFSGVNNPFLPTDLVEIEVLDSDIEPDGSFDPSLVRFSRVTVVRDGIRHEFSVNSGSRIKETGGNEIKEAGDTFFTTNDAVGPPATGPFAGVTPGKMVFSTNSTFATGQTTSIDRTTDTDLNNDGDTTDPGETADGQFNAQQANTMPCYAPGTRIGTDRGDRAVETLRPGDLVLTRDHGAQPVIWCRSGAQSLDGARRDAWPVRIRAGALGPGRPRRDLVVSPQHRLLVGSEGQLQGAFPAAAFAPAKALTALPGIRHMTVRGAVTWVHFACARHEIVRANGCWSESLLLGPVAQQSMTRAERDWLA